jgi:peptidoglycan-associated lipoprotein
LIGNISLIFGWYNIENAKRILMKRKLLITTISFSLLMIGCAEKKINTIAVEGKDIGENSSMTTGNSGYETVDRYSGEVGGYTDNASYGEASGGIQNLYFAVDQYIITPEKLPIVRRNAKKLQGSRIKIEGHCDASGSDEYNYALGLRRAKAAKEALVNRGIKSSAITMVSMGESSPESTSGFSRDCYSKNRRVEFRKIK